MIKITKEIVSKQNEEYNTYKTLKDKYEGNIEFNPKDTFLIEDNLEEVLFFLGNNGFTKIINQNFYDGCNWIYVNLINKKYIPGKPGINVSEVVFNHSITLDEFKNIFEIYNKYELENKQGYSLSKRKR